MMRWRFRCGHWHQWFHPGQWYRSTWSRNIYWWRASAFTIYRISQSQKFSEALKKTQVMKRQNYVLFFSYY